MAKRHRQMQELARRYRTETGKSEIDTHELARWAVKFGMKLREPADPYDMLAREFSQALREEVRYDEETGRPYRANHAVRTSQSGRQLTLWVDIENASRSHMMKSITQRREQMIGDAVQLSFDADHWNRINPTEKPIEPVLDFTDDVAERKSVYDEEEQKAS